MQYVRTEIMNMQELVSSWSTQSPEQLVAKASQHLPPWVALTLVVLIAYYLARITWLLYPIGDQSLWTPPHVTGNRTAQGSATTASAYDSITAAHLFGTASQNDAPAVVETEDAPETRLNLKLRAAVAATDSDSAHAIIADGSGNEKVYFVGSSIPGGASLHRVHADRIILNRGGVLETLRLPREFDGKGAAPAATRRTASARETASAQEMINANAASFVEIIRPQPFMPNGKMKGYRVFPGRNRQQFIALGLRPGDLVTAINGVTLDDPSRGMEIFRTLGDATQVDVTVERAGQRQDLSLSIADLAGAAGNKR
jgi:general secretion pathway protein C